jgi:hypothetical protein
MPSIAPNISLEQIESLYIGKGRCCRCGCGGEYFRVSEDPKHAKKINHFLKKLASGKYDIYEQDGSGGEYIYEINLSKSGHDRVATFYVKPMVDNAS